MTIHTRRSVAPTLAVLAAAAGGLVAAGPAAAATPHTYYVSVTGADGNSGTSPSSPWRTIDRVNATRLGTAGARVRFAGGQNFAGCLLFDAGTGGTPGSPLTVDSYGPGRATITCSIGAGSAIRIHNTGGVSVSNLNLVNTGGPAGGYYGVELANDLPGGVKENHIRLDGLDISGFSIAGVGLHAEPADRNPGTGFRDVRITHVAAHGNRDAGIESFSNRDNATNPGTYNFDSLYIGSSRAYDNPGIAGKGNNSGNGIVIGEASNVTIERSTAHGNGTANDHLGGGPVGIWVYQTTRAVIRSNESYDNSRGTGDSDGGGFDLDGGTSDSIVADNYSHDNDGAGVLVFQYEGGRPLRNNIVRGNVSVNDARKGFYGAISTGSAWAGHPVTDLDVSGNRIYVSATTDDPGAVQSGLRFWNGGNRIRVHDNLVATSGGAVRLVSEERDNPGITLDHDAYRVPAGSASLFVWNGGVPQYTEGGATTYPGLAAFRAGTGQERHGTFGALRPGGFPLS
jgi:hypothetical protein